ncbi:hypothetical protein B296_00014309 [Ensete ventricosum]|uniref:Uncharacterized protein n=1 Tax=Ensete ventricosum TaxID=4639 RepID=A0A426ZKA0_ENSVE|nr:hypothetical protein B296_00014309 [Ensete ventricosum]
MGKGEIDGFDRMGVLSGSVLGCREKHSAFFGLDQWRLRSTSSILYGVLVGAAENRAHLCVPTQFRVLPPHAEVRGGQSHAGDVAGNMFWARLSPDRSLSSSATPYRPLIKPRSSQLRSLCSALWTSFRRYREAIGGFPITYPGFPVTVNRFACSLKRRSSIDSIWFAANGV